MLRLFALVPLLALVALVAPPAAVAGPMSWSYRTTIEPVSAFPNMIPSGYLALPNTDPAQAGAWTRLPGGAEGSADGSATISLASASRGDYQTGSPPPGPGAAAGFRMLLEITDGASGLVGHTQFGGRGVLLSAGPESELQAGDEVLLDLGRHRYDITARAGGGEETARIFADVVVTDLPTAATPEPATLLMAGLGLAGVGLRRVRR